MGFNGVGKDTDFSVRIFGEGRGSIENIVDERNAYNGGPVYGDGSSDDITIIVDEKDMSMCNSDSNQDLDELMLGDEDSSGAMNHFDTSCFAEE